MQRADIKRDDRAYFLFCTPETRNEACWVRHTQNPARYPYNQLHIPFTSRPNPLPDKRTQKTPSLREKSIPYYRSYRKPSAGKKLSYPTEQHSTPLPSTYLYPPTSPKRKHHENKQQQRFLNACFDSLHFHMPVFNFSPFEKQSNLKKPNTDFTPHPSHAAPNPKSRVLRLLR